MTGALEFTGERFIPGAAGEIWYEHWHRYHFAAPLVAGREVLDVACGEGYGSALLARARRAGHRRRHRRRGRGPCARALRVGRRTSNSGRPTARRCRSPTPASTRWCRSRRSSTSPPRRPFLDEVRRVLRPDGLLILSCPNKTEYTDKRGVTNEFHVRELYRDELAALIAPRFAHAAWYGQRPSFYSVVWPEQGAAQRRDLRSRRGRRRPAPSPGHARPLYFIVVASAAAATPRRRSRRGCRCSPIATSGCYARLREGHARPRCDAPRGNALDRRAARTRAPARRSDAAARRRCRPPPRPSAARLAAEIDAAAARDRAPRELALVARAAAAPAVARADRQAAVG